MTVFTIFLKSFRFVHILCLFCDQIKLFLTVNMTFWQNKKICWPFLQLVWKLVRFMFVWLVWQNKMIFWPLLWLFDKIKGFFDSCYDFAKTCSQKTKKHQQIFFLPTQPWPRPGPGHKYLGPGHNIYGPWAPIFGPRPYIADQDVKKDITHICKIQTRCTNIQQTRGVKTPQCCVKTRQRCVKKQQRLIKNLPRYT